METPSRRVTRSQTLAAAKNNEISISKQVLESEKGETKSLQRGEKKKQQQQKKDRSALIDITNNSPIVGLAKGGLETPSKTKVNGKGKICSTPGSGEALLRGQVKTLLQKVEEEAEFLPKIHSFEKIIKNPFQIQLHGVVHSPMGGLLLAPTPANTPQLFDFSSPDGFNSVSPSPIDDKLVISQIVIEESVEAEKDLVTRSLFLEFSDKLEAEEIKDEKVSNDDEQLCEEFKNMSMKNGEDEVAEAAAVISPGALRLKGLPMPKGKHIRFLEEDSDEEDE